MTRAAAARRTESGLKPGVRAKAPVRLYTLEVAIMSGPITERFAKENPIVARTIEIRGDQTLARLHAAIFDAFDRFDEHLYEFQIGGKRPMDPKARRYGLPEPPSPFGDYDRREPMRNAARTKIDSLDLAVGGRFGYWFDFGDDWWHQVSVKAIAENPPSGRFPRVTERVGESPPQYADWEELSEE